MLSSLSPSRASLSTAHILRPGITGNRGANVLALIPALAIGLFVALCATGAAQPSTPAADIQSPAPAAATQAAASSQENLPPGAPDHSPSSSPSSSLQTLEPGAITEEEIRRLLAGKDLFLRGRYLDNTLGFDEHGALVSHSPQGSYTLCGVRINKVHLTKHKVELEGQRFGLHFLGALAYEDPTKAVDRVNITPKKKFVKITIDRERVVKLKQKKEKGKPAPNATKQGLAATSLAPAPGQNAETTASNTTQPDSAAIPPADRPADEKSVTTTTSQAHANNVLRDALNNVFAQGFDTRMMATMPVFWKLYYDAAEAKADYYPKDSAVLRQSQVDKKARLLTNIQPESNQYAQEHGVAGLSLYHVVVGADGKPGEIAVARPIGFGLDESAVNAIRDATFEPAMKDSKPVPVMLDLVVEFRIYSKRTAEMARQSSEQQPSTPSLPGPYNVQHY